MDITLAANDVLAERRRQAEGWTREHDDSHRFGELAYAASAYAYRAAHPQAYRSDPPPWWPWSREWFKPGGLHGYCDARRTLVKAGALILAEIERLDRLAAA